jgi:hypothetical protein
MEKIVIYFNNEEETKLYEKLREMVFQRKAESMSGFMKACTYEKLYKEKLIIK